MRKKGYIVTVLTLVILIVCAINMNSQHKSEGREPIVSIVEESSSGEETSTMPQSDGYIVEPCDFFEEGVYLVKSVEEPIRYGVVDQQGTYLQPIQFSRIEQIEEADNLAIVEKITGRGVIEEREYDIKKRGCINSKGMTVLPVIYDRIKYYPEKIFQVEHNEKCQIINTEGEILTTKDYEIMEPFYGGLSVVEKDGKRGYLSKDGTEAIPLKYDFANNFRYEYKGEPYAVAYPIYKVVSDNPEYLSLQMENPLYVLCQYEIILSTGEVVYRSELLFVPEGLITGDLFQGVMTERGRIVIYDTSKLKRETIDINGYYNRYAIEYKEEPLYDVLMWVEDIPYKYVEFSELKDAWEAQKAAKKEEKKP